MIETLLLGFGGLLLLITVYDLIQKKHAILRNFPVIGHFRYLLEMIGPELRQYIVTSNNEERPFSRDQRRWVYSTAKKGNNYFGFGSDEDMEYSPNYIIFKHSAFPINMPPHDSEDFDPNYTIHSNKVMGEHRGRKHQFRPSSIINVSAMSYGSLSAPAVEAINRGCHIAGALHNTGEGGISPYHQNGGDLIWQIGTAYFGCRDDQGNFDLAMLLDRVKENQVKAIEIKLSQGAKPGAGGILLGEKVTKEVSEIRGIPQGKTCMSPSAHSAFHDVDSLLDFVEKIADATGLPVGIKSAVGHMNFWEELADSMKTESRGVDFITIDGGEGGTGAAPLVFTDHIAFPFKIGFSKVYKVFLDRGISEHITFIGSGKLGFPESAMMSLAMGCDMINVGRTALLSLGCIQAQRCHTGQCPTGVATQSKWLMRGLDPTLKANRLANYIVGLRKELQTISYACGYSHPGHISLNDISILDDHLQYRALTEVL